MGDDFDIGKKAITFAETLERAWDTVKDTGSSVWYNTRCFAEYQWDVDNVLNPESSCQADVPHLLYFAGDRQSPKDREADGVFEMSCPKPRFLNTGPHRTMIWISSYRGESYVMAIEEARGIRNQNLFIGSFSPSWQEHLPYLPREYIVGIVSAAVYAMGGIKLNPQYHDFDITVVDPHELEREGCRPSPKIYNW